MKRSRRDRRFWLVSVGLCLLSVAVVAGLKKMSHTVPYSQCSEVYKRYSEVEGVRATYVKDYRVNDTLTVGVTLLEATDSAGWEYLLQAFNIPLELTETENIDVWMWYALRNQPEKRYNLIDNECQVEESELEIVSMSTKNQEICIFHTQNKNECHAVFDKRIEANM